MNNKPTRFEIRLPADLAESLDEWRRKQSTLPNRAEAARQLMIEGKTRYYDLSFPSYSDSDKEHPVVRQWLEDAREQAINNLRACIQIQITNGYNLLVPSETLRKLFPSYENLKDFAETIPCQATQREHVNPDGAKLEVYIFHD